MPIKIECPECGSARRVNDRLAGRRVRCPECDAATRVPEQEIVAAEVATAHAVEGTANAVEDNAPVTETWPASDDDHAALAPPSMIDDDESSADVDVVTAVPATTGTTETLAAAPRQALPAATAVNDDGDDEEEVFQRAKRPEEEMDMTPMVDVTFLLLIFFMVTAAFSLQRSIEMPKQQTEAPSPTNVEPEETEMVDLEIDQDGMFRIISDANETSTPSKMALILALKEANTSTDEPIKLNVKVHEDAEMKYLVYGMDAGTMANYAPIIVTQVDGFEE